MFFRQNVYSDYFFEQLIYHAASGFSRREAEKAPFFSVFPGTEEVFPAFYEEYT